MALRAPHSWPASSESREMRDVHTEGRPARQLLPAAREDQARARAQALATRIRDFWLFRGYPEVRVVVGPEEALGSRCRIFPIKSNLINAMPPEVGGIPHDRRRLWTSNSQR